MLYSLERTLTRSQAIARIQAGADAWGSSTQYGAGKLDALFTVKPLGVTISGPNDITQAATYTWTANPSGGNGTYAYQWQYRAANSTSWFAVGTAQSYSRLINSSQPNFYLTVTVTSLWRSTATGPFFVLNETSTGCNPYC